MNDEFELWNLKVEVVGDESAMLCKHTVGDSFDVCGEDITFSSGGSFSMYALAAICRYCRRNRGKHTKMTG